MIAPLCKFYGWDPTVVWSLTADEIEAFGDYATGYIEGDTDIRYY